MTHGKWASPASLNLVPFPKIWYQGPVDFLARLCQFNGALICAAFCLSVCPSVWTLPKIGENNSYLKKSIWLCYTLKKTSCQQTSKVLVPRQVGLIANVKLHFYLLQINESKPPWVSRIFCTRWGHRMWHHKLDQMVPNSINSHQNVLHHIVLSFLRKITEPSFTISV